MRPRLAAAFVVGTMTWLPPAAPLYATAQAAARASQPGSFRNTAATTRYVGSRVCGACHSKIYSSYLKTGMGRSILAGEDKRLVESLPAPATVLDEKTGEYFQVFRIGARLYQSQYAVDRDGKEIFRETWPLAFVLGAGDFGYGFVIEREGHLFEAPMTYYTRPRTWGLSPGYELRNEGFGRLIAAECIGCHSGRPQPVADRVGAYREPPLAELAIGCENCHGPGALHVGERQTGQALAGAVDTSIVNPARLPGWLADNICMRCHQGGDVRVTQPGKLEQDFRPGTPLDIVIAIFKVPLNRDSRPQSVLLEHYFAMTLSKCYRASAGRLRCITCHDPHSQPAGSEAAEYYRARCVRCHKPESCSLPATERLEKSPTDDCVSCHMPKRGVTTIAHTTLTDHSIAARPGETYPEEAFVSHTLPGTGLLHVTAVPGESSAKVPPVTLLHAYLDLIRDGRREFIPRKDGLVDQLARSDPQNPAVLMALSEKAVASGTREGLAAGAGYVARAIEHGAARPDNFLLLAELYRRGDRHEEAVGVLEKGMLANPFSRELYEMAGAERLALGQPGEALKVIRRGLELFPDDTALRMLERDAPQ